ncbi:MAG: DTW domain-containing protein, partial [Polaromonas sp.]
MGHLISPAASPAKRARCPCCLQPQSAQADACICRWVTPVVAGVDVLILQHPIETHNPKGTARLLHLSLPGSQLLMGEVFAP